MIDDILNRLRKVKRTGRGNWLPLPDIQYLRECFSLDRETGWLTWRTRPLSHFSNGPQHKRWNTRYAGQRADVDGGSGYFLVCINSVRYKSHRVVFCLANDRDPMLFDVDHVNRNRSDNRPSNLRLATNSQNTANLGGARSDNRHGGRGVTWNRGNRKWEAWAQRDGKRFYLGLYADKAEALSVAASKRRELFGEFFA